MAKTTRAPVHAGLTLGELVRLERARRHLRQFDVAVHAKVSPTYVSMLERSQPVPPYAEAQILHALSLNPSDYLDLEDTEAGNGQ